MAMLIVEQDQAVTLLGGGAVDSEDLRLALGLAPRFVAVDGGANMALELGVKPEAVVGDFDSISDGARAALGQARMVHIAEQDTTDFDKALRHINAPLVIGVGFLGARIDHQLAALNVLAQPHPSPCILVGEHEVLFHLRRPIALDMAAGDVVSLYPLQRVQARSTGLEWPIDALTFDPISQIGTSNRALGPISLTPAGQGLMVMLPKHYLKPLVDIYLS